MHRLLSLALGVCLLFSGHSSRAQTAGAGFAINRFEPTTAGEWSFSVDHPWYSSTRYFAAGISLNYAHNPLIFGLRSQSGGFTATGSGIEHQLTGHIDLAGSFLDRILIRATLPIVLLEKGSAIAGIAPIDSPAVSDPRFGVTARLFGQPYRSPFSINLALDVWIPINSFSSPPPFPAQVGESGVRVLPKLIFGGLHRHIMWSATGGFYYRPEGLIGNLPPNSGNTTGSSLEIGIAIAYADYDRRFAVGPEISISRILTNASTYAQEATSLEVLVGAHYNIAKIIQLSAAVGFGALREPGTPDARAILRLSYAPLRPPDQDRDGIPDGLDVCPTEPMGRRPDPERRGCPIHDKDEDGVLDEVDQCPTEHAGPHPDPSKPGCPLRDTDGDGVFDPDDVCPTEPMGNNPDKRKRGCPVHDRDGDGVYDYDDLCVEMPAGPIPDPQRPGCPDPDSDGDGIVDSLDQCKTVKVGYIPDPDRPGCPLPDRDHDMIPDSKDACPDQPGAPSLIPSQNGCPGLVQVNKGMIVILQPVFFATNKDVILKVSFKVLNAVAAVIQSIQTIKKVSIEGHTDNAGDAARNRDLSERRAKSVLRYLIEAGVEENRLEAHGYGPDRPVADNKTPKGRALNRRVDFRITDPLQDYNVDAPTIVETPSADPPAEVKKPGSKPELPPGAKPGPGPKPGLGPKPGAGPGPKPGLGPKQP